jgi:serine-type D-Ala-D-Ala carboxypeptidase/endopeptidase (penicillin-binding protein 4)
MKDLRRTPWIAFALAVMFFGLVPAWAVDEAGGNLARRIRAVMNRSEYRHAQWGILVVDAETGETVFEFNADALLLPASVTKLFTIAAALGLLGADYVFETPVYRRGRVANGTLTGDLILVASGDVTLGGRNRPDGTMAFKDTDHTYANGFSGAELTDTDPLAGLKSLARQVKDAGIRKVTGDVFIDDRLFDRSPSTGSGPTVVSPIVVNDNVVDVTISPGTRAGEPAQVRMRPETSFVRMDAQVTTADKGQPTKVEIRSLGGERFTVRGQIALGDKPHLRMYPVEDQAGFARALFIECLRAEGISVAASPLVAPRPELPERNSYSMKNRVALFKSLPLSEVIKVTLKVSHNLYASTIPLLVASRHGQRTLADGLRRQCDFLKSLDVDVHAASFGGGAGGDRADHVSARATVQLVRAMAKRPDFPIFEQALPVLGVDGTLARSVGKNSPARGRVRAKTGTYVVFDTFNGRLFLTSKALAGLMTDRRGRRLQFAMFVNNVPLPTGVTSSREGRVLGHLCEILYEHGAGRAAP